MVLPLVYFVIFKLKYLSAILMPIIYVVLYGCQVVSFDVSFDNPAEEKKVLAEDKAKEIEEQNKVIAGEKKDAESSLAEALPALEAARTALQDLEKSDVTEIRCCFHFKHPTIQSKSNRKFTHIQ